MVQPCIDQALQIVPVRKPDAVGKQAGYHSDQNGTIDNSCKNHGSLFDAGETGFLRVRVLGRRDNSQTRVLVPGIPVPCELALMQCWDKRAEAVYDDAGSLQAWEPV